MQTPGQSGHAPQCLTRHHTVCDTTIGAARWTGETHPRRTATPPRTGSADSTLSPMRGFHSDSRFRQNSCRACPNHDPSSPLKANSTFADSSSHPHGKHANCMSRQPWNPRPSRIMPTASTRTACRAKPETWKPGTSGFLQHLALPDSDRRHPETRSYSFHAPGFGSSLWRSTDSAHLISSNFQPDSSLSSIFLRVFG